MWEGIEREVEKGINGNELENGVDGKIYYNSNCMRKKGVYQWWLEGYRICASLLLF